MTSPNWERRPSGSSDAAEASFAGPAPTLPKPQDMTDSQWQAALGWYRSGYVAGEEAGRRHAIEESERMWKEAARVVHKLAGSPPLGQELTAEAREREQAQANWRFRAEHRRRRGGDVGA